MSQTHSTKLREIIAGVTSVLRCVTGSGNRPLPGAYSVNSSCCLVVFLQSKMSEASAESFDDVQMSREGMRLLLCNDWKTAESLFDKHK